MTLASEQQLTLLREAWSTISVALGGPALAGVPGAQCACGGHTPENDPALMQPAGCFVTLHDCATHGLRGCIGRLDSQQALLLMVREMAIGVLRDPRFVANPITLVELPRLDLDISILSPLQPAASPMEFDLLSNGIYLILGNRAGCFLPQVARETGWTKEQLLARLCSEKMGLPPDAWQHPQAKLLTFTTLNIGPISMDQVRPA